MTAATPKRRWPFIVLALLLLAGTLWLLIEPDSAPAPDAASEANSAQNTQETDDPEPDAVIEELLPELQSLKDIDLDQPTTRRTLDLQHWTTDQGARVYFMQAEELPMLDVQLLFAAGASRDDILPGLATMTNGMLNEGSGEQDAGAIAAGFERLGAEFTNSSHRDMALAGLRTLTAEDKLDAALAQFAKVVAQPSFPEDAFERLRNQLLASLKFRLQRPSALASEAFWHDLYPDHPYGSLPEGTTQSLQQLTPASLRDFHQQYYTAGNAVIALVGDIDRAHAQRIAQRLADALPSGDAAPAIADPQPISANHHHIDFQGQQTHILVGQHGINRDDPDYAALYVGNQILGGSGFGSRLMQEIREDRGLSYSVSSRLAPMQAIGPFMISMQTRADQVDQALTVINDTLDSFIEQGPTEAELIRTKRQISGQFPLSTANNSSIVSQLGMIGFYGLPLNHLQLFLDQVQTVTTKDIREAFARHLDPQRRLVVTVGPATEPAPSDAAELIEPAAPAEPTP